MKKIAAVITAFFVSLSLSICTFALNIKSDIPTRTLNKILDSYRAALKNGEDYVSLSQYGISGSDAYDDLYTLFIYANGDVGSLTVSKYSETYVTTLIETNNSGIMEGVRLLYNDRYRKPDGTCDTELVKADQKLITERYQYARSLVNYSMSDAEKALVLYDFVITATDYATDEVKAKNGNDVYSFVGVLRDGQAVCTAYAKLYAILLNDSGIPAVTVESSSIDHEWVMARINGKWYHADPTWDDLSFFDGYTILWDLNNDSCDIGAVTHNNFLKSDEEIIELSHPDWKLSNSVNPSKLQEPPVSGSSGAFDDKFFSNNNPNHFCLSKFNYINGNWYFVDTVPNSTIRRATYSGDNEIAVTLPDDDIPKYSFGYENALYICSDKYIYRYDTISEDLSRIMEIPAEKRETDSFTEMRLLYDTLTLVKASYIYTDSDDFDSATFTVEDHPMSEVSKMEAIVDITAEEADSAVNKDENDEIPTVSPHLSGNLTRPGGASGDKLMTPEQRAAVEAADTTSRRISAIFMLLVSVVFIIMAFLAVILAIKNSKK